MIRKEYDISVVITCYNEAETIKESIESALNQKVDCDFEVVVVDDKSKDSGPSVIKEMMRDYDNLTFVQHHKNLGHAYAGNVGVAASKGKYIVRLDGDDIFLPGILHSLWEKKCDERADIVIGDYTKKYIQTGAVEVIRVSEESIPTLVMCGNLVSKEAFYRAGGIKQILFEEYDLYLRLKKDYRWAYTHAALYEYRQYGNSMCNQPDYWKKGTVELLKFWDKKTLAANGFEKLLELAEE